jgi:anti-sigma factor RsiW
MTSEALEFSISQYLDGNLPTDEEAALVERLATDPAARALFAEY